MTATYSYNPLKEAKSTRFVRLLPGTSGGIQCQIFRARLDERVEYIALSYAWGSTIRSKSITCNGRTLNVTDSLFSALMRLRLPDEPRTFWVDAICINQDDIAERNRQVALVRDIYRRAQKLYIWLGPGDKDSTAGVNLMRTLAAAQRTLEEDGVYQSLNVDLDQWISWSKLLHRGWFERMWVIQELAMGLKLSGEESTLFLCGVHRFGLQELKSACEWCVQLTDKRDARTLEGATMLDVQRGAKRVIVLCDMTHNKSLEEIRKGSWRQWLLSKVADTRDKKATDPRDRLFALYGFLNDGAEPVAVADYSKSVNEVFHDFALDYILESQSLDILSEVEEPSLRTVRNIPSWVPYWASSPARAPLLRLTGELGTFSPIQNFSAQRAGGQEPDIFAMNEHAILVDGVCVDEIATVHKLLTWEELTLAKDTSDSPCILLDLWRDVASHLDPYQRRIPAIEAFYKTLICGREEDDRQALNFVVFWRSLHAFDLSDLPTFCISKPEIVQLLCRRPAGADILAHMHEICSPPEELEGFELENTQTIDAVGDKAPDVRMKESSSTSIVNGQIQAPSQEQINNQTTAPIVSQKDEDLESSSHGALNALLRHASAQRYRDVLLETANQRVFFTTKKGFMGMGVQGTQIGDLVCFLSGAKNPFVLRPIPTPAALRRNFIGRDGILQKNRKVPRSKISGLKTYSIVTTLVGEAYVHALMRTVLFAKEGEVKWDRIALV